MRIIDWMDDCHPFSGNISMLMSFKEKIFFSTHLIPERVCMKNIIKKDFKGRNNL